MGTVAGPGPCDKKDVWLGDLIHRKRMGWGLVVRLLENLQFYLMSRQHVTLNFNFRSYTTGMDVGYIHTAGDHPVDQPSLPAFHHPTTHSLHLLQRSGAA